MSKENFTIIEQMRRDLMTVYRQVYPHCMEQWDAWVRTVESPAPRYYVSAKQACQIVTPMFRGDYRLFNKLSPLRQKMYKSIYDRVEKMSESWQYQGMSIWAIMPHALNSPAPQFFILPQTMKKMFERKRAKRYTEDGRMIYTESFLRAQEKLREKRRLAKEQKEKEK